VDALAALGPYIVTVTAVAVTRDPQARTLTATVQPPIGTTADAMVTRLGDATARADLSQRMRAQGLMVSDVCVALTLSACTATSGSCGIGTGGGFFVGWLTGVALVAGGYCAYRRSSGGTRQPPPPPPPSAPRGDGGIGGGGGGSAWVEATDPSSGRPYFVNKDTGATAWERP